MPYTVYIIYSYKLNRYYIGYTTGNVLSRLQKHNAKHNGFTGKNNDWVIKHSEIFETKTAAMKRERGIKSWKGRNKIEALFSIE